MSECHYLSHERNILMIFRYSSLVLTLLNVIVIVPATCRHHGKLRNEKTVRDLDTALSDDMISIRQLMDDELPRQVLVDILHKGQYFQDIFAENLEPLKIQFGHVCENPHEWEQRFERKDLKNNKHQGKVRWGNKNEEYGEHYWDLNHGQ